MALDYEECQAMIQACEEAGVSLFVAYYRRRLARFLKIKELLNAGAIGAVRFVSVLLHQPARPSELDPANLPWRVLPEIAGGGIFVDLAAHQLDFLDYVLGPITDVSAFSANQAGNYPAEDIVSGAFRFESGVQGMGTWCFNTFDAVDRTEIVGSHGRINYSTFGADPVLLETDEGQTEFAIPYPAHIQQPLIQSVVDDLLGLGHCPSTGKSGARTSWVMDQMLAGITP